MKKKKPLRERNLERQLENCKTALQVIRTWASFDLDHPGVLHLGALDPEHVVELCDKTLAFLK